MEDRIINGEQRQSISLSKYSEEIIQLDCSVSPQNISFTGIINLIIQNSLDMSFTIMSKTVESEKDYFSDLLKREKYFTTQGNDVSLSKYSPSDLTKAEEEILSLLAMGKIRDTLNTLRSYPKEINHKIRLQNKTLSVIEDWECSNHYYEMYFKNRSDFIKAILEEYAHRSPKEREQILYKDTISDIQEAIEDSKPIRISYKSVREHDSRWDVKPYKIVSDSESLYNYLVGFSKRTEDKNGEFLISSFRISRIDSVKICRSTGSGRITANARNEIEKKISDLGPQFLIGDNEDFEVFLSETGYKMFKSQLHLRPFVEKQNIIPEANNCKRIYFKCSRKQVESYFFKFGKDAIICKPKDFAKEFQSRYQEAVDSYNSRSNNR